MDDLYGYYPLHFGELELAAVLWLALMLAIACWDRAE